MYNTINERNEEAANEGKKAPPATPPPLGGKIYKKYLVKCHIFPSNASARYPPTISSVSSPHTLSALAVVRSGRYLSDLSPPPNSAYFSPLPTPSLIFPPLLPSLASPCNYSIKVFYGFLFCVLTVSIAFSSS